MEKDVSTGIKDRQTRVSAELWFVVSNGRQDGWKAGSAEHSGIRLSSESRNMSLPAHALKILLVACSEEEVSDAVKISNLLSGIEYKILDPGEQRFSRLRVLEFAWNGVDIELWCLHGAPDYRESLPAVTLMDSCGLILVSSSPPVDFIQRNNSFFFSIDFPIMWITNEQMGKQSHIESSLQTMNVTKVAVTSADDSLITSEFNHWLIRVKSYLSGTRNH